LRVRIECRRRLLDHRDRLAVSSGGWGGRIWRRCDSMSWTVHATVATRRLLHLRSSGIAGHARVHVHIVCDIRSLLHLHSLCLRSLLGERFGLLLLLDSRRWRPTACLEAGVRLERTSEFLLSDERMGASLLWRPSFKWVDVQQTMNKVNEGFSVSHFCENPLAFVPLISSQKNTDPCPFR
jgi:hypothetical protein